MKEHAGAAEEEERRVPLLNLRSPAIYGAVMAGLFLLAGGGAFLYPLNQDAAYFLMCGERMLDGARLYRDIIDVNVPILFQMTMFAARLGRVLRVPSTAALNACVLALVAGSLWMCARIARRIFEAASADLRRCFMAVLAFLLLFGSINNFGKNNFGQKEHVMFVMAAPYVLAAAACAMHKPLGRGLGFLVGLFAGVGLALKPHFFAGWALIELYLFLGRKMRRSWLRPENVGVALVCVAELIFIFWRAPEYPRFVSLTAAADFAYENYGSSAAFNSLTVFCFGSLAAFLLLRPSDWNGEIRRLLALACAGFLVGAMARQKGWYYHYYPAKAAATLLLTVIALGLREHIEQITCAARVTRVRLPLSSLVTVLVLAASVGLTVRLHRWTGKSLVREMAQVIREHARGRPVSGLTYSSLSPMFPAVNEGGGRWNLRFGQLWLLSEAYARWRPIGGGPPFHSRKEMGLCERMAFDGIIEDVMKEPPELVIVEHGSGGAPVGAARFDLVEYFSQDRRFAEIWKDYAFLTQVGDFRFYKRHTGAERRVGGPDAPG